MYQYCFHIWPDDGSFQPKHVAEFLILIIIYIYCCVIDWNKLLYYMITNPLEIRQSSRVWELQ